jgi:hypothetical protein
MWTKRFSSFDNFLEEKFDIVAVANTGRKLEFHHRHKVPVLGNSLLYQHQLQLAKWLPMVVFTVPKVTSKTKNLTGPLRHANIRDVGRHLFINFS